MSTLEHSPTRTALTAEPSTGSPRDRPKRLGRETHRWARLIHVYTSMIALLIVLFFAATGLTLNHPEWTFGDELSTTSTTGVFPFSTTLDPTTTSEGAVDFLSIAEYARAELGVVGRVDSFAATNGSGSIAFVNPGYRADVSFDVASGEYELTVEQQGWVAVVNDLHKGRSTGTAWKWVIDLAAGLLVAISVTGLVMQLFLRKRRRPALLIAVLGSVMTLGMIALTLR
jgi:hypothetical protein